MKLQTLAGLERKKIEDELKEKLELIKELKDILSKPQRILEIIKEELKQLKEKYGDKRRTRVYKGAVGEFSQEDLTPNEETIVSLTEDGYIKRLPPDTFRLQKRGGKGVIGGTIKEGDAIDKVITAMTHDNLLFFTDSGKVFQTKAYEIPVSSRTAKGNATVNFLQMAPEDKITSILALSDKVQAEYLVMATTLGKIKKTALEEFKNVRRNGLIAISLSKGDSLGWAGLAKKEDDVLVVTANGQSIRFKNSGVRAMGRGAGGVRSIKLRGGDWVIGMNIAAAENQKPELLVVMENGYGKRTLLDRYKVQSRGGSGIKTAQITSKTGRAVSSHILTENDLESDLIASSNKGQIIRTPVKSISQLGRATQGVRIMRLKNGEKIAATTLS